MNVILIPFFLAANVVVDDPSKWTYGPEYTYSVNMTYVFKSDPSEPIGTIQLISALKCRPKLPDRLSCHLQNSTTTTFVKQNLTRQFDTEQLFEIKFNERGVEGLLMDFQPSRIEVVNLIRKIVNQFSVGADMKRKIGMPQFMTRENTSMGDCATMYKITREEPATEAPNHAEHDPDSRLVVLPMSDARPGTALTIEKSRMGCINSPRYVDFASGFLKMGRFFSRIRISDPYNFHTFSELDGKLRPQIESPSARILSFKCILWVNLENIEATRTELPSISYGEWIDLNMNTEVPSNIID